MGRKEEARFEDIEERQDDFEHAYIKDHRALTERINALEGDIRATRDGPAPVRSYTIDEVDALRRLYTNKLLAGYYRDELLIGEDLSASADDLVVVEARVQTHMAAGLGVEDLLATDPGVISVHRIRLQATR